VYLPEEAPWLSDFLEEHSVFPVGAYDDQVDATTQALNRMMAPQPNIRFFTL